MTELRYVIEQFDPSSWQVTDTLHLCEVCSTTDIEHDIGGGVYSLTCDAKHRAQMIADALNATASDYVPAYYSDNPSGN